MIGVCIENFATWTWANDQKIFTRISFLTQHKSIRIQI